MWGAVGVRCGAVGRDSAVRRRLIAGTPLTNQTTEPTVNLPVVQAAWQVGRQKGRTRRLLWYRQTPAGPARAASARMPRCRVTTCPIWLPCSSSLPLQQQQQQRVRGWARGSVGWWRQCGKGKLCMKHENAWGMGARGMDGAQHGVGCTCVKELRQSTSPSAQAAIACTHLMPRGRYSSSDRHTQRPESLHHKGRGWKGTLRICQRCEWSAAGERKVRHG